MLSRFLVSWWIAYAISSLTYLARPQLFEPMCGFYESWSSCVGDTNILPYFLNLYTAVLSLLQVSFAYGINRIFLNSRSTFFSYVTGATSGILACFYLFSTFHPEISIFTLSERHIDTFPLEEVIFILGPGIISLWWEIIAKSRRSTVS